jgi:hypothetical protein
VRKKLEECAGSHSLTGILFGEENGDLPLYSQPGEKSVFAALKCASTRPTLQISNANILLLADGLTHVVTSHAHLMLTRNKSALNRRCKSIMHVYIRTFGPLFLFHLTKTKTLELHRLMTVASLYLLMVLLETCSRMSTIPVQASNC